MTEVILGKLAPPNAERDAIHVAVVQVQCGRDSLHAGQRIGFGCDGRVKTFPDEVNRYR